MIVVAVVIGIALALCVAGWVPVVRDALRPDHVLPGPPVQQAVQVLESLREPAAAVDTHPDAPLPEAVSA